MNTNTGKRPNVLLLYTDQQRCDSLACYGSPFALSPNLDRLASEGARLASFHVNAPVCTPSRMAFLSGLYPSSIGVGWNGYEFPERVVPLQSHLGAAGYRTANLGKLHFQPHAARDHTLPPKTFGFDHLELSDEPGCYDDAYIAWVRERAPEQVAKCRTALPPAAVRSGISPAYDAPPGNVHQPYVFEGEESLTHSSFVAERTCQFLKSAAADPRPFFAVAGFYAPHAPINPPGRFLKFFDPQSMRLPVLGPDEKMTRELAEIDEDGWRRIAQHYYALAAHVDDCVGRILSELESLGLTENTLVVFTSDHGEYLGDHGRIQKGMPAEDCISRVPFLARLPGVIPAQSVREAMAEAVDFVPTVLEFCGVNIPRFVQGRSMMSWLCGGPDVHRDSVLIEAFEADGSMAQATVKTADWTYFFNALNREEKLFDRIRNPGENRNLAGDPAMSERLSDLRALLARRLLTARCGAERKLAEY